MSKPKTLTIRLYETVPAHKEILDWIATLPYKQGGRTAAALEQALLTYVRSQRVGPQPVANLPTPPPKLAPPTVDTNATQPIRPTAEAAETSENAGPGSDDRFARFVKGVKF